MLSACCAIHQSLALHLLTLLFHCADWPEAQHELTDGQFGAMQFHADPAMGVLQAGQGTDIALSFAPTAQHR